MATVAATRHLDEIYLTRKSNTNTAFAASPASNDIEAFKSTLSDPKCVTYISEGGDNYANWTGRVWNKYVVAFPWFVVRVCNNSDIVAALSFAVKHNMHVCIAGGCQSAIAMEDGALVIDLFNLRNCQYDAGKEFIMCEGGALMEDVDRELAKSKRALPTGINPDTGIGGYVLGGGCGWLSRKYGFMCDCLIQIEIVLLDGKTVIATESNEYSDLLWACRGGGRSFGVMTKLWFKTFPCPNNGQFLFGDTTYFAPNLGSARKVLTRYFKEVTAMSDDCNATCCLPCGASTLPIHWAYCGAHVTEGAKLPEAVRAIGLGGWFKLQNTWGVKDYYEGVQRAFVNVQQEGFYYQGAVAVKTLSPKLINLLLHYTRQDYPNRSSSLILHPVLGATKTMDDSKTALEHRNALFWIIVQGKWEGSEGLTGRDNCAQWCKRVLSALQSLSDCLGMTAHPFTAAIDSEVMVMPPTMFTEKLQRLMEIKRKYDPKAILQQVRQQKEQAVELAKPITPQIPEEKKLEMPLQPQILDMPDPNASARMEPPQFPPAGQKLSGQSKEQQMPSGVSNVGQQGIENKFQGIEEMENKDRQLANVGPQAIIPLPDAPKETDVQKFSSEKTKTSSSDQTSSHLHVSSAR